MLKIRIKNEQSMIKTWEPKLKGDAVLSIESSHNQIIINLIIT